MRWRTATSHRKARQFQARLRRPLPPIQATETGWLSTVRVIFTPKMRKTVHVFADSKRPFPPLASAMSAGTAETQSGSGLQPASAVGNAETPNPNRRTPKGGKS